jgi:DNA-binding NarL/FixJ family response regulator
VKELLEREPDFTVVGEAGDGVETLRLVERLVPEILILDLVIPGLDGLDVLREVRRTMPSVRVIVLSMHSDEAYVREALARGGAGYVLKTAGAGDLIQAVRAALDGRRYLSPPLSELAIEAYAQRAVSTPVDPYHLLTTREREVLRLAAEGLHNADIGTKLFISSRTVEVHRAKAMRKLGLRNFGDLLRYALRRGIVLPA